MTTQNIIPSDRLASLLEAGHTVSYEAEVTGGWFADLRDPQGRRVDTGLGATQEQALAHLAARAGREAAPGLDGCESPSPKGAYLCTAGRGHDGDHEARDPLTGKVLATWPPDAPETLEQVREDRRVLIRAVASACAVLRQQEIAAARDGGLGELLAAGHAVSFTYEPADGYRAVVDVFVDDDTVATHVGIAATPAGALAAARTGMGSAAAA